METDYKKEDTAKMRSISVPTPMRKFPWTASYSTSVWNDCMFISPSSKWNRMASLK
ncbi:MAG: hypothetical protein PARBB_02355 [Parabacteroides distasonis]